jgi:acyl-CoA synthetase (AMP-forming)/AMP-acid ligase II
MNNLGEYIRQNAERYPEKVAFVFENKNYTFKQVNQRVNSLINALADLGVKKGDRVAILSHNCPQYFEVFGITKGSRICVPLHSRSTKQELVYLLNNSRASTVIVANDYVDLVTSIRSKVPAVKNIICLDAEREDLLNYEDLIAGYSSDEPTGIVARDDPCVIFYTSATTGRPKGAVHTQESMIMENKQPFHDATVDDVCACVMPFFHAGGSMGLLFPCFCAGATIVVLRSFDENGFLHTLEEERVTITTLVPIMINRLLENQDIGNYNLKKLRTIMYTGAPTPIEVLKTGIRRLGNIFVQIYGQTEANTVTFFAKEDHKVKGSEKEIKRLRSAGKPSHNCDVRIVNDNDEDVQIGHAGEIILRSPQLMKGYWKMPEESRATFRGGWLHTGDIGRMDEDGFIYLVDRKYDIIISGGENIYSKEIEDILNIHPAVSETAVIGVPDKKWGESAKALIVLKDGMKATGEEIIDFCKQHLNSLKTPKSVEFWEELPRNQNGKIKKTRIRERFWVGYDRRIN